MPQAESVHTTVASSGANQQRVKTHDIRFELAWNLAFVAAPTPPYSFEPASERAWFLLEQAKYLRTITEAIRPVFEKAANDAADNGARIESFDIVQGAVEDFISGFTAEADALEDAS